MKNINAIKAGIAEYNSYSIKDDYDGYMYEIRVKEEANRWFSCCIPAYGIYYSCKNNEDIKRKGKTMVKVFFKVANIYNPEGLDVDKLKQ